ncbi:hypothetical protein DYB26_003031 [Aphanomyces astaci]|uniref:Uncharacterized protein n=1 Tax=Aphanomyces astaci TaxID=112090 RepID=A0A397DRY5_APHAT|nr:hypothetical protein DYB38_006075 [Aphanomyces astaci]RHZ42321.1 hypothetical protein DYB26_003031 [Aphanomyces astaci]
MVNILAFLTVFATMASATANRNDNHQPEAASKFCWKATHTRGIGRVPESCAAGQERLGLLSYDKCPLGMTRVGLDCHSICPRELADQGLFCRKSEYGRGLGTCAANEDIDAGLCYPKCKPNYTGVGPVCWGRPPPSWVHCGMGAAKNSRFCALAIKHQVISVGVLAFNILTAFTASSINVLQAPANAAKISKLSKAWMKAAPQFKTSEKWMKAEPNIKVVKKLYNVFNGAYTGTMSVYHIKNATYVTNEDYVRTAAIILSVVDPTGIAGVVGAYTYITCDKIEEAITSSKYGQLH